MNGLPDNLKQPLATLLLALADDKLMLGHRNSDWTGLGPILEEDIAFSHMAQDEMAHAQAIYEFVASMLGTRGGADELAFGRTAEEYRCAHIVEVPDEFDWATAMARKFYCDHFDLLRLQRLSQSQLKPLADLSRRMADEEQLHVTHVDGWMKRLGRGTVESRVRMETAVLQMNCVAGSLFEPVEGQELLVETGIAPLAWQPMLNDWMKEVDAVMLSGGFKPIAGDVAKLTPHFDHYRNEKHFWAGRRGVHTPHLKELLDEMCEVYRIEPGAAW